MKQIPFTLEAFGPDGLLKDGYEVRYRYGRKPDFVKAYDKWIRSLSKEGSVYMHTLSSGESVTYETQHIDLILYRRTRTAEEIANEYYQSPASTLFERFVKAVQAGMDEMTNP